MSSSKSRATRKNKENPKCYLEDYTSAAWTSHDYSVATSSTAATLLAVASSSASPPAAPTWAPTSPTTSPMEASKVKVSKSFREIEKVSKPRAHHSHISAAHPPRADQHRCIATHPLPFLNFRWSSVHLEVSTLGLQAYRRFF
ncbi:hypothetical protein PS1_022395 [Malus domestica]